MGYLKDMYGQSSEEFKKGMKEGIKLYAWWKNGEQFVGTTGRTLKQALKEVEEGLK